MARTESFSCQVHPNDEQSTIELMEKFHWSLLSTQEIKTIDNHLKRIGDTVYQVRSSEHYVKLAFTREVDFPNGEKVRALEKAYFDLPEPNYPALLPVSKWLWIIGFFVYGISLLAWPLYYFLYYKSKKQEADRVLSELNKSREAILFEVRKYDSPSSSLA